ncbi:MAG: DUF2339 domain-containing protein [bacterium]|nr:DUF2339 domain-containing protein [bacterium]
MSFLLLLILGIIVYNLSVRMRRLEEALRKKELGKDYAQATAQSPSPQWKDSLTDTLLPEEDSMKDSPSPLPKQEAPRAPSFFSKWSWSFWAGALALGIGGILLGIHIFEQGLLGPGARILLGCIFGLVLISSGEVAHRRSEKFGDVLPQALIGSGLIILLGVFFAATTQYHLIATSMGFALMAVVMALGVTLSLRYGIGVALISLVGGMCVPLLVQSEQPQFLFLSGYITAFTLFSFWIAFQRRWLSVALVGLLTFFGWFTFWILAEFFDFLILGNAAHISLLIVFIGFSLLISAWTAVLGAALSMALIILCGLGTLTFSAGLFFAYDFHPSLESWLFYLILMIGLYGTAFKFSRPALIIGFGILSLNFGLLLYGETALDPFWKAVLGISFLSLLGDGGWFAALRKRGGERVLHQWAFLSSLGSLGFGYVLWSALHTAEFMQGLDSAWPLLSFITAAIFALVLIFWNKKIQREFGHLNSTHPLHSAAFAYLIATVGFSTYGFSLIFESLYFGSILAVEAFATVVLCHQFKLLQNRGLLNWLLGGMTLLILTSDTDVGEFFSLILALFNPFFFESILKDVDSISSFTHPFWQLGVPGLFLLLSSQWAAYPPASSRTNGLKTIDILALILIAGFLLISFTGVQAPDFGSLQTSASLAFSLSCLGGCCLLTHRRVCGQDKPQDHIAIFGQALLVCAGIAHIILEGTEALSFSFGRQSSYTMLFLWIGVPALIWGAASSLHKGGYKIFWGVGSLAFMMLGATLAVNLTLSYPFINSNDIHHLFFNLPKEEALLYGYSLAWLLLGVLLMGSGVVFRKYALCQGASFVLALSTAKIFLWDVSALSGLARALSFLILGGVLVALGVLYQRLGATLKEKEND